MAHQIVHIIRTARAECSAQARIVAELSRGLERRKYNLHCCFLQSDGPLSAELEQIGIRTFVLGWNGRRRDWATAIRFIKYLRQERFVITHQHGGAVTARLLARAAGVKANVLHLHSCVRDERGREPLRVSPCAADAVIATSKAVAKCISGVNTEVIYPGVDGHLSDLTTAKTGTVIGTAARLVSLKGLKYLIRAVALVRSELPQVRLLIAGAGPEQSQLEREVRRLGLEGCVEFLGWQAKLNPCFDKWDIFALPSVEEAFGIAALEAMAAGLPVVATDVGGMPELVVHGSTGWLVPPRDSQSMAKRLIQLLRCPEERHRMGTAAQARACSHFSCKQMVNSMTALYDSLIWSMG